MKAWGRRLLLTGIAGLLAANAGASSDADEALRALLAQRALRGSRVGVVVASLESGKRLLARNPNELLVPASNQKLLLAATALAHWGPAARFETPVFVDGPVDAQGVLMGTLWIQGR